MDLQEAVKETVDPVDAVVVVVRLEVAPREEGDVKRVQSGTRDHRVQQHSRIDGRLNQGNKEYNTHFLCGKGRLYDI